MSAQQKNLSSLLPSETDGWKISGQDKMHNEENLYEHINGGAELFISYGFNAALTRVYTKGGEAEISVDIFDMKEPKNAFGVFSHSREGIDNSIGQGCQIYEDAVLFWKNKYYVSISSFKSLENTQPVLIKMANYISETIGSDGSLPEVLSKLPGDELIEQSVLYFNHYAWQNAFYYLGDDNYLNITKDTDAVLAKYGKGNKQRYLMMIRYPDKRQAEQALKNFRKEYLENGDKDILRLEDDYWAGTAEKGKYVMVVLHANSEQEVRDLLKSAKKSL